MEEGERICVSKTHAQENQPRDVMSPIFKALQQKLASPLNCSIAARPSVCLGTWRMQNRLQQQGKGARTEWSLGPVPWAARGRALPPMDAQILWAPRPSLRAPPLLQADPPQPAAASPQCAPQAPRPVMSPAATPKPGPSPDAGLGPASGLGAPPPSSRGQQQGRRPGQGEPRRRHCPVLSACLPACLAGR